MAGIGPVLTEEEREAVPVVGERRPYGQGPVRQDLHALGDENDHPGGGVGEELGDEVQFQASVGGPVEAAPGEGELP
jgi:hypothetical protein